MLDDATGFKRIFIAVGLSLRFFLSSSFSWSINFSQFFNKNIRIKIYMR